MNIVTIQDAFQAWVVGQLSIECIFANQGKPVPTAPFVTILVNPPSTIGHDELLPIDNTGDGSFKGNREFTLSLQIFGSGSLQRAVDLRESLEREASRNLLHASGIVFIEELSLSDISETLDTTIEERTALDLLFRVSSIHTENVGVIEHVIYTGTYVKPDETTIVDSNQVDI